MFFSCFNTLLTSTDSVYFKNVPWAQSNYNDNMHSALKKGYIHKHVHSSKSFKHNKI